MAPPAFASFNGAMDVGFGVSFVIAAVIAIPSGLFCGAAELVGVRHRPPQWIGWVALVLSLAGVGIVLGIGIGKYDLQASTAVTFIITNIVTLLVYLIPALMSLALVTLLPAAQWRLMATWSIAIGISWGILFQAQQGTTLGPPAGLVGALFGGASVSMLMWQVAFVLGQRQLRSAGIPPTPGPDLRKLMGKAIDVARQVYSKPPPGFGRLIERGFLWWLGGAVAYYVAIPILAVFGNKSLLWATLSIDALIAAIVGFGPVAFGSEKYMRVWTVHGLAWSVIVVSAFGVQPQLPGVLKQAA